MKYLLITPPLTQLNTPYPATATLKAYLDRQGFEAAQMDLGIELIDKVYSPDFLNAIGLPEHAQCVEAVKDFLRGKDDTWAPRIANQTLLPQRKKYTQTEDLEWAFGTSGTHDRARYLATLFLEEIADHIKVHVDERFELIRYGEYLSNNASTFDELEEELATEPNAIDRQMLTLLEEAMTAKKPDIVGFAIPFPGCLFAALRCGQYIRRQHSEVTIVFGGGFPNTEWRQLSETRIFDYCDFITLDDGELPLAKIGQWKMGKAGKEDLVRTFYRDRGVRFSGHEQENISVEETGKEDFSGLPLEKYLSTDDVTNPMHRLWSCGRWNKMMVAHGCYWAQCAFCDTTLDYIRRFVPPTAKSVVDRMEQIAAQTGSHGFHFVDEALPPQLLRALSEEIVRRKLTFTWWGNIRFEKAYSQELCDLMSKAGCIAVSGGLELASDRLLKIINKGVTVEQTMTACRHFRDAGIMVHTYLMYGFPTETLQETQQALENVRRMFAEEMIQSAFWHRYAMTCHSESGKDPERFGARRCQSSWHPFCNNEVDWMPLEGSQQFPYDIEAVGDALRIATYNYMNGAGLDMNVKKWFKATR